MGIPGHFLQGVPHLIGTTIISSGDLGRFGGRYKFRPGGWKTGIFFEGLDLPGC